MDVRANDRVGCTVSPPTDAARSALTLRIEPKGLTVRARWHRVAGSAVPADAWAAWKAAQRCAECGGTGFHEDAACGFCDATGHAGGSRD